MRTPFRYGNRLFSLAGQLLIFPALKDFIADVFGYGWDRNRAIDSKGAHGNALMGGYLLAASNTVIAITGILTTDTIKALTKDGLAGSVAVNGTISFSTWKKYGAFEVYRGTSRIGRYCLTERQGLQITNQITGGLPNGLLGGTTTTVWQRSNAFYSETNERGYSISGTGWVTSAGASLTVGTIVPADHTNPTKCMAWVSGVQQDLQFVGKARNSVSVVPLSFWCNADRRWQVNAYAGTSLTHTMRFIGIIPSSTLTRQIFGTIDITTLIGARTIMLRGNTLYLYYKEIALFDTLYFPNVPIIVTGGWDGYKFYLKQENLYTGAVIIKSTTPVTTPTQLTITSRATAIGSSGASTDNRFDGTICAIQEFVNDVLIHNYIPDQHSSTFYDTVAKTTHKADGVTTNIFINSDVAYNIYNQTGYELWYNGTDYRIYPLSSTGTRITTPAGYTLVETVTAGSMPSIADSRFTTFKYALANSYAVRQSVPEAFDTTDQCAPKLSTYSELSALSANPKVIKTEADGKITNIKIK